MSNNNQKMPMYGVGPVYVAIIIAITICGILLDRFSIISSGKILMLKIPFIIIGIALIILSVVIWCAAVFKSKIDNGIKENKLITSGIYGYCRNPIYTAFIMLCTAFCLFTYNVYILLLPFVYWALLTLFMKNTEEKWLYREFGNEYIEYCKKVNRCIPWFKRK